MAIAGAGGNDPESPFAPNLEPVLGLVALITGNESAPEPHVQVSTFREGVGRSALSALLDAQNDGPAALPRSDERGMNRIKARIKA